MLKLKKYKNELFTTMIPPNYQKVCSTDDDYFDLIKYCWECIGDVSAEIEKVDFYREDCIHEINHYKVSIHHLHTRINECYEYLELLGNHKDVSHVSHVFTAPLREGGK